ncbi:MAG: hypothetical protein KF778_21685 [Rhodocyclaceae bacterium]|nr:hypothetical protein [Rhodocyclaceae bacterium]
MGKSLLKVAGHNNPGLVFDLNKTYEENNEAFKLHVLALDPVMAEIFFKHLDTLLAGDDPGGRANRTAFNHAVLVDLEVPPPADGDAP